MTQNTFDFKVEPGESIRIDKYLSDQFEDVSRSQIQRLIEAGSVSVNGMIVEKTSTIVLPGDSLQILLIEDKPEKIIPEGIPLDLIYENENVLVINKESGMVVHPGAGNYSGTVVNALLAYYPPIRVVGEPERPGVVHRLDKETSGVLVFAKTNKAYKWLVQQFKSRELQKIYLALVDGHPPTPTGRIEAPITRDIRNRTRMAVGLRGQGKEAISEYFERQRYENHSYLEVHLLTGRTHQIRVHLSYIGAPVTGDTLYGHRKPSIDLERFFLHASALSIKLPGDRAQKTFTAPLPEDLQSILNSLNKQRTP
jgi:23S rRNA pseudouridine1911/1915/1917 synthase